LLEPLELEFDESGFLCNVGRSGSEGGALFEADVPVEDCVPFEEESDEPESDEPARRRSVGRSGSEELWLLEAESLVEDDPEEDEPDEPELLL
jgi:hypothetical protein